jgi:hypothetical protein
MGVSTRACRFASRVGRDSQSTGTRKGAHDNTLVRLAVDTDGLQARMYLH